MYKLTPLTEPLKDQNLNKYKQKTWLDISPKVYKWEKADEKMPKISTVVSSHREIPLHSHQDT